MNLSLRLRLLIGTVLTTAIVLGLLSAGIYYSVRRALISEFDNATLTQARALAAMTEQKHGRVKFEFDPGDMPEFETKIHPEYFQIWIDGAGVLGRSDSLAGADLPRPAPHADASFYDAFLPDGRHGRWINLHFTPPDEDATPTSASPRTGMITLARGTGPLNHTLEQMQGLLITLCAAATLLCGGVLMAVVRGALKPVTQLSHRIESLSETDLSQRFDPTGVPAELAPMVDRLNGLLSRLQDAFARERLFTADVAHELRTPLAGLRTTLEVSRSRPRDTAAYEAALDKCALITQRMQEMVQRLLLLARADARQLTIRTETLDLRPLLEESWAQFRARAQDRRLSIQWGAVATRLIQGDRQLLRIVLDNLFDNAVSYANVGGTINVATNADIHHVELVLCNTGSQIDAADTPKVFHRFWRGDQARSHNGAHCGLGLSLCERLLRTQNGHLAVESKRGSLFVVRLRLIAASPSDPASDAAPEA